MATLPAPEHGHFSPFKGPTGQNPSPCAEGFTLREGICYKLSTSQKQWDDAEAKCNELPGGHLAAFHSSEDFNFLIGLG